MSDKPLFDLIEAKKAAEEGIRRVASTHEEWLEEVQGTILACAQKNRRFTSDLVWMELTTDPHNKSAMGPALRRAVKAGVIENSGEFERSIRVSAHRKPIQVWRSLVFEGGGDGSR